MVKRVLVVLIILLIYFNFMGIRFLSYGDEYFYSVEDKELKEMIKDIDNVLERADEVINQVEETLKMYRENRGMRYLGKFIVTAYDLSVQSTGKRLSSRGYGITASGRSLRGKSWREARAVAVDKNVIPLGSLIYVEFLDENFKKYDGFYIACDTGSAIKGNRLDLFMGDFKKEKPSQVCIDFGKREAVVYLIKEGE